MNNQRVLITGGAGGIGSAISARFVQDGARVAIIDSDLRLIDGWRRDHASDRVDVQSYVGDVSDPARVAAIVDELVARWGGLDVLVNNAALSRYEDILDITPESWREVVEVNLSGYFFCAQAAARIMVQQEYGRIINVASVNSFASEPLAAHYAASKGGVAALTRSLAIELGKYGVTANAVAPGPVRTQKNKHLLQEAPLREQVERTALGRPGEPEEVAAAVAWLSSPESGLITGQTLLIDGGLLARI